MSTAKNFFARVLASRGVQFVSNEVFPQSAINAEECKCAYADLSRTEQLLVKSRINRQVMSMRIMNDATMAVRAKALQDIQKAITM